MVGVEVLDNRPEVPWFGRASGRVRKQKSTQGVEVLSTFTRRMLAKFSLEFCLEIFTGTTYMLNQQWSKLGLQLGIRLQQIKNKILFLRTQDFLTLEVGPCLSSSILEGQNSLE